MCLHIHIEANGLFSCESQRWQIANIFKTYNEIGNYFMLLGTSQCLRNGNYLCSCSRILHYVVVSMDNIVSLCFFKCRASIEISLSVHQLFANSHQK